MEESDRSEPTARHNTNNAAPCALSVYAQSGRAEQRDSAFPAAFPRQRRSLVSTSPRRWLMLRRCRNYSASEQFDEGFGLDSGREMCRSGVSPGYNWMEGKRGGGRRADLLRTVPFCVSYWRKASPAVYCRSSDLRSQPSTADRTSEATVGEIRRCCRATSDGSRSRVPGSIERRTSLGRILNIAPE